MDRSVAYLIGVIGIIFVAPFLLAAAEHSPWVYLAVVCNCLISMFLMYLSPGFPLFRFFVFLAGVVIIVIASVQFGRYILLS